MNVRWMYWLLCFLWLLIAVLFPRDWYDVLPMTESARAYPISGVTLFQLSFVFEACIFMWLALRNWQYVQIPPDLRFQIANVAENKARGSTWETRLLFAVIILGLFLRLFYVNSDLWLDELVTANHSHDSLLHLFTLMISTNNHLLNSLMIKFFISIFGETEWSIRMPAVFFGVLCIPVIYWVSRMAMSRWMAVFVALLLALSYHHIFFSQNARGYSLHLFFTLACTGLFVRGLKTDDVKIWIAYGLAMLLNIASLMSGVFVILAHVLTTGVVLIVMWYQGKNIAPLFWRMFGIYLVIGVLVFQLYSIIVPQYLMFIKEHYTLQATGFSPFTMEFLQELVRGISAGFGTVALFGLVPFMLLAVFGTIRIFKNNYVVGLLLLLPGVVTAAYLLAKGLTFSPRFFLFELFFALMAVVAGIYEVSCYLVCRCKFKHVTPFSLTAACVVVLSLVFSGSLIKYYSVPKQNYRESLNYAETERKSGQKIIVIYLAEQGIRYYRKRLNFDEGNYYYVRSVEKLDKVMADKNPDDFILISTFHRALRIKYPELFSRMKLGWVRNKRFDATIGDGALLIWKSK